MKIKLVILTVSAFVAAVAITLGFAFYDDEASVEVAADESEDTEEEAKPINEDDYEVATSDAAYMEDCTNTVVAEAFTFNFPEALRRAESERVPIVVVAGSSECGFCARLRRTIKDEEFKRWIAGTGIYLVDANFDKKKRSYAQRLATEFVSDFPFTDKAGYPYVGVYWVGAKEGDKPVKMAFTGRRREMPVEIDKSIGVNFEKSLELLLGDYLRSIGRKNLHTDTSPLVKNINVKAEGPGTVAMKPADGAIIKGRYVKARLSAKADADHKFLYWKSPSGKRLKWNAVKPNLKYYELEEGVYTAVFE